MPMFCGRIKPCPCGGDIVISHNGDIIIYHEDSCAFPHSGFVNRQVETPNPDQEQPHHCPKPEPTIQDLIEQGERGDWKPLNSNFYSYQDVGRTVIMYEMLKALLEKAGK